MSAALRRAAWTRVCAHLDGLAIGTTVAALHRRSVLAALAGAPRISLREIEERFSGNPGFLHVGLRLLACQGWLVRSGEPGTGGLAFAATPWGRAAFRLAPAYDEAAAFLPFAGRVGMLLDGEGTSEDADALSRALRQVRDGWRLPVRGTPAATRVQVQQHLDGHVVGPIVAALARRGLLTPETRRIALPLGETAARPLEALALQGWATVDGETAELTPTGAAAALFARQYWHPLAYLETLVRVPELLFGDCERALRPQPSGGETHVDRALDIRFSGELATQTCGKPVLEVALPLFDTEQLAAQPSLLVDIGCGDGSLVRLLFEAVRERTLRGRHLAERPLAVVAVDPSPVARAAAASTLGAAAIPHRVLDGDVADPGGLAGSLRSLGLDPEDALHLSKSVIHNRRYRGSADDAAGPARSTGAFATPDGAIVPNASLEQDLVAHLASWSPIARRHGLLVVEAHTAPLSATPRLLGRSPVTALDATHGYSCQYPVEAEVFAWAARAAGFRPDAHREIGGEELGYVALTIDRFVPTPESPGSPGSA